ncbi:hypothetical protein ACFQJC_05500 [Haloferax namakaokahaiae]|uniref:Peptidase M23 domain-containing protein n=1 Tax=Haloferax namakaokahaiae TaxID=1748331 RepID=A0ABD5ZCF7_9EURY
MVGLPAALISRYERFSLYNSPYPAHDHRCAIDLYLEDPVARSPVAGVVRETRTVRAPTKPYAHDEEYLILVDVDVAATGLEWDGGEDESDGNRGGSDVNAADGLVARILHVEPSVSAGDELDVGDPLGRLVRSGFFAPWVANHIHLGFRRASANHHRARGSLPLAVETDVTPLSWDGCGTVVETGETYVVLDDPIDRSGSGFVGIASDEGAVLDGGLAHYVAGGTLSSIPDGTELSLFGTHVGTVTDGDVPWADIDVFANGERVTGLSLFASQIEHGAKVVCPGHDFGVGDELELSIGTSEDPIRLG